MSGDIVTISGYTPNNQRKEAKPAEDFDMNVDSQRVAVEANKDNNPGPAYILQLSKEAREILAKQRNG